MRERGLAGQPQKRWRHPPSGVTTSLCLPNVLDRSFTVERIDIAGASHYVQLDRPIEVVAAILGATRPAR
jgi:hypothetical protein